MEMPITPVAPNEAELKARQLAAIEKWKAAVQPAKEWQGYERATRQEMVSLLFPQPIRGTNRFVTPDGGAIKMTYGFTYTLGDKDLVDPQLGEKVPVANQVNAVIQAISQLGPEAALLASRLIKWEPKLAEKEYRDLRPDIQLEAEVKKLIDSILTTKPASPQVEIEKPKAK